MSQRKTAKELALLHDLYIATDWGERFSELVDQHIKLPKQGRTLYIEAGFFSGRFENQLIPLIEITMESRILPVPERHKYKEFPLCRY